MQGAFLFGFIAFQPTNSLVETDFRQKNQLRGLVRFYLHTSQANQSDYPVVLFLTETTQQMKKILIIQAHPDKESYNFALSEAYKKGALAAGAEVQEIIIRELDFNPNLQYGYRKRTELEPDLLDAQAKMNWAEHLVIVFPVWWGSVPAMFKGFLDRVLLPGFAFKKREDSLWWDKFLTGKSARIISTLDQPAWFYRLRYGRPSYHAIKQLTLHFIGISPVRTTTIGPIRNSKDSYRQKWLHKIEQLGKQQR